MVFDFLDGTTPSYCADCGDVAWTRIGVRIPPG